MNEPAPVFGRGGWVCAALLLGLFAGGGVTWAVLSRHPVKAPLIVYQLPPSGANAPDAAKGGLPAESESPAPPSDASVPTRDVETVGSAPVDWKGPSDHLPPVLTLDSDHILRSHPKSEGCLANALAALAPFTKKGFDLRDKVWEGEISLEEGKAMSCQLFKGNEYCFCVGTEARGARLSLQLYGADGTPEEAEQSGQELAAGASATVLLRCRQTGTYFVVVKLEAAAREKVPWGMVSAYR